MVDVQIEEETEYIRTNNVVLLGLPGAEGMAHEMWVGFRLQTEVGCTFCAQLLLGYHSDGSSNDKSLRSERSETEPRGSRKATSHLERVCQVARK